MKSLLKSVIAAACLVLVAAPAWAQAPGIDVRINPRIGLYQPLSDLASAQDAAANTATELSGSLALGLGVELGVMFLPVNVRLNLDYATGSQVEYGEGGVETEAGVETTLLAVVGDVMFRPFPKIILAQPYFFAGGGLKQYDFSPADATDPAVADSFQDESDWTIHLGGGLDVGFGPLALNAEVGDYISWFQLQQDAAATEEETEIQHDLFVTVGFSIGIL